MKYIFTLFSILLFIESYSQNDRQYKKDSAWINASYKVIVDLPEDPLDSNLTSLPFNGFIVKDVRADSSYIGVKINKIALSSSKTYSKVAMQKSTSVSLMKYLNSNPNFNFTSTGIILTCYIKQLRITEIDSISKLSNSRGLYRKLLFVAEGYLTKENNHYAALRLDTIATSLTADKNDFTVLTKVLHAFAAKAALIDTGRIFKRNAYTASDLDKRYQQSFNKPILQAQQLNRGVYKTFNEFVNNNPSVLQFKFEKDKKGAVLYTKTDGNDLMPERKAFGFCDGRVIWINARNVFYPLIRQGNTFEFLSVFYDRRVTNHSIVEGSSPAAVIGESVLATAISNALIEDPSVKMVHQLNMENGDYD